MIVLTFPVVFFIVKVVFVVFPNAALEFPTTLIFVTFNGMTVILLLAFVVFVVVDDVLLILTSVNESYS
jgi:hypothetical protein